MQGILQIPARRLSRESLLTAWDSAGVHRGAPSLLPGCPTGSQELLVQSQADGDRQRTRAVGAVGQGSLAIIAGFLCAQDFPSNGIRTKALKPEAGFPILLPVRSYFSCHGVLTCKMGIIAESALHI